MSSSTESVNSDYKKSLLSGLDLFQGVCPDDVQQLLQDCDRRDLGVGELLLSPGQANENVYVVLSGALNVHVADPDSPILATMEVGACAGEMSIIEDRDPSAYVIASEPTHLLVIHKDVLLNLILLEHIDEDFRNGFGTLFPRWQGIGDLLDRKVDNLQTLGTNNQLHHLDAVESNIQSHTSHPLTCANRKG